MCACIYIHIHFSFLSLINSRIFIGKSDKPPVLDKKSDKPPVSKNLINPLYQQKSDKPPVFGKKSDKIPVLGPQIFFLPHVDLP